MKIFFWRALKDILPTQSNLAKRKILNHVYCQCRHAGVEDVYHSLVDCKFARKVWKLKPCFSWFASSDNLPFSCFAQKAAEILLKEEYVLFVAVAWSIWKSRNKALYENSREDCHQVLNRAIILLESIKASPTCSSSACYLAPSRPSSV